MLFLVLLLRHKTRGPPSGVAFATTPVPSLLRLRLGNPLAWIGRPSHGTTGTTACQSHAAPGMVQHLQQLLLHVDSMFRSNSRGRTAKGPNSTSFLLKILFYLPPSFILFSFLEDQGLHQLHEAFVYRDFTYPQGQNGCGKLRTRGEGYRADGCA